MVTINVKNIVSNYSDNESGLVLLETIKNYLNSGQSVAVSFDSVSYVSTSFVNSSFINLLQDYSFNEIKKSLTFVDSNVQINSLIKERFAFEVSRITIA